MTAAAGGGAPRSVADADELVAVDLAAGVAHPDRFDGRVRACARRRRRRSAAARQPEERVDRERDQRHEQDEEQQPENRMPLVVVGVIEEDLMAARHGLNVMPSPARSRESVRRRALRSPSP